MMKRDLFKEYSISMNFSTIGRLFNTTPESCRSFYLKGEKYLKNNKIQKGGRPSKLSDNEEKSLIQEIIDQEKNNTPLGRQDLLEYIYEKYKVQFSDSWVDRFLENYSETFIQTDAIPMEEKRADITSEQLKQHLLDLEDFISETDPNLLFNCDESGLDNFKTGFTKKVIVTKQVNKKKSYFRQKREDGHITFLCSICSSGEFIKPLIIITRKTMDEDLKNFGFPNSKMGLICQSESGFINKDLFMLWLTDILIPYVQKKRIELQLGFSNAGLILDGCLAHDDQDILDKANENLIFFYFLPAHSSHITQPCDQLIFTLWKKKIKKIKTEKVLTKQSKRIYLASKALNETCTF
jgi:transposase